MSLEAPRCKEELGIRPSESEWSTALSSGGSKISFEPLGFKLWRLEAPLSGGSGSIWVVGFFSLWPRLEVSFYALHPPSRA